MVVGGHGGGGGGGEGNLGKVGGGGDSKEGAEYFYRHVRGIDEFG